MFGDECVKLVACGNMYVRVDKIYYENIIALCGAQNMSKNKLWYLLQDFNVVALWHH